MSQDGFHNWLQGAHVLVAERATWSDHALWIGEVGATVTRLVTLETIDDLPSNLDAAVVDIEMHGAMGLLALLPPACSVVLVAAALTEVVGKLADDLHAALVLSSVPRVDLLFEVQRAAELQVPDIGYLVGRAEQLWNLPRQQARVLFYNLWSHSDREIAQAIGISVHTVQEHQNGLRRRTGVRTKHGYLRCLAELAGWRPPLQDIATEEPDRGSSS